MVLASPVYFIDAQLKDIQLLFKSSKQRRRNLFVKDILDKVITDEYDFEGIVEQCWNYNRWDWFVVYYDILLGNLNAIATAAMMPSANG